jgi:mono/diheme cytochrome c family protein
VGLALALSGCASGRAAEASGGGAGGAAPSEAVGGQPIAPVYTDAQASRGERVFTTVCAVCHGRNEFVGPIFAMTWMAEPVGSLFEHISTAMPQDRPGSLAAEEYAAIVAYLLRVNGRPAGERELPADAELLARMRW